MRVLLDTHAAIWAFAYKARLSSKVLDLILDKENELCISIVSAWEIAIKCNVGKLDFPGKAAGFLELTKKYEYTLLGVEPVYIIELEKLPNHHKDPFDRLLVSTAIAENIPVVTTDENIPRYAVECIW
jgi:PIN domain nuclease of toxin-antitoxin system